LNRPAVDGGIARGIQHKYRETVLFFPNSGQTCHAYCAYCFRWPQFIGAPDLRFGESDATVLPDYLRAHPEVTDVLITGGDPLVMRTSELARFVEPLLAEDLCSLRTIRIGTKSLAYWPRRFVNDTDADELLALLERIRVAGKEIVIVAHWSHPRELTPEIALRAIERVRAAGARVHCQAPIIRGVNDDADTWCELWSRELALGCVPYYMFVERDTGPRHLYEVPLMRAHEVFRDAYARTPGLARTVRGPVMSTSPGKVVIDGVLEVAGESMFVLRFLQARDPAWVGRPFLARLDEDATWWDDLVPFGGDGSSWPVVADAAAV
jgi:KamA family protein